MLYKTFDVCPTSFDRYERQIDVGTTLCACLIVKKTTNTRRRSVTSFESYEHEMDVETISSPKQKLQYEDT